MSATAGSDNQFRVRGLDRDTAVERILTFEAQTEQEAIRKAADLGMVVERVEKVDPVRDEDLPEEVLVGVTWEHCQRELRLLSPYERLSWILTFGMGVLLHIAGWARLALNVFRPMTENYDANNSAAVTAARILELQGSMATLNALAAIAAGTLLLISAAQLHERATLRRNLVNLQRR